MVIVSLFRRLAARSRDDRSVQQDTKTTTSNGQKPTVERIDSLLTPPSVDNSFISPLHQLEGVPLFAIKQFEEPRDTHLQCRFGRRRIAAMRRGDNDKCGPGTKWSGQRDIYRVLKQCDEDERAFDVRVAESLVDAEELAEHHQVIPSIETYFWSMPGAQRGYNNNCLIGQAWTTKWTSRQKRNFIENDNDDDGDLGFAPDKVAPVKPDVECDDVPEEARWLRVVRELLSKMGQRNKSDKGSVLDTDSTQGECALTRRALCQKSILHGVHPKIGPHGFTDSF